MNPYQRDRIVSAAMIVAILCGIIWAIGSDGGCVAKLEPTQADGHVAPPK